jgi:amidase
MGTSFTTSVTTEELESAMETLGMSPSDAELYVGVVEGNLAVAAGMEAIPVESPKPVERSWRKPAGDENPLGAWYVKTDIPGAATGKLAGRTLAVKDNLLLAGVPLMNGTHVLEGYTPDVDSEIITRALNAGARIIGKTVCEAYCFSGGSHTSASGPVRNPHNPAHSAGGSSSGSGAVIAAGEADLAIGCDQGGSVRMPSSFCGIVGMKPTFGLVPYTGILGMNPNIDHTGPMTANVADNALLLEVMAGSDGVDSRQSREVELDYDGVFTGELGKDLSGLRVGVVREGFGGPGGEAVVDDKVRAAAALLGKLGATVAEVSVPLHPFAGGITFGALQAILTSMFHLDGCLLERPDVVPASYIEHQSRWRDHASELPANVKSLLITCEIMRRRHGYTTVSRAMQRLPVLRAAYDEALAGVDVLVMPTTPMRATPLPEADAAPDVVTAHAFAPLANTGAFNSTHHPALSVPCGLSEGLPVGMMLVGAHFSEGLLYRVGHAFEQHEDWRTL